MIDDPEFIHPDDLDRALAVHEAGHAVVAHALGADVVVVEIDLSTGNGTTQSSRELPDDIKNLAICVAGCKAEQVFDVDVPRRRDTSKGDFRQMRRLLTRMPAGQRRAARAEGYRLAEEKIRANKLLLEQIAEALLARRWTSPTSMVRIEGNDLAALFGS